MRDGRERDLPDSFGYARLVRLARDSVVRMGIDLTNIRVLTEAATGPFAVTALIASLAGAKEVVAVARDSNWGAADEAIGSVRGLAESAGVEGKIRFFVGNASEIAAGCDLVTNLGFVRPINRTMINALSPTAAVALMWEPWEFRAGEVDLDALRERDMPIVATAETHPYVRTFDYLGPMIARLLLNNEIEIMRSRLLLVGSEPFGGVVSGWLTAAGASVLRRDTENWACSVTDAAEPFDALILVEHRDHRCIIDSRHRAALNSLRKSGSPIVRVAGTIDRDILRAYDVALHPDVEVPVGFMAITTAHAGPRAVVDLHAAGLKAASLAVRARQAGASRDEAVAAAVASGYGLALEAAS